MSIPEIRQKLLDENLTERIKVEQRFEDPKLRKRVYEKSKKKLTPYSNKERLQLPHNLELLVEVNFENAAQHIQEASISFLLSETNQH